MLVSTLVIGIGNEFRGDDSVGVHFARQLQALNLTSVKVLEASGEGTALMELWAGVGNLFICDAVCTGGKPGTIHVLEPHKQSIPSQFFNYSTHAFSLAEAIEMSRVLGKLPAQVTIYGIEGESFVAGTTLTAKVQVALAQVVGKVKEIIEKI